MPAGHEIEFDRILVDEITALGHACHFLVPEGFVFKFDYNVPIHELAGGEAISYAGVSGLKKIWLSFQREIRRVRWFDDALKKIQAENYTALIIPTSTYRYTRALLKSNLKNSPVPVIFIVHGVNPKEINKINKAINSCKKYKNIHFAILTLRKDFVETENLHLFSPPVYTPRDLKINPEFTIHNPLRLGFFGQYRKEKNLEFFLEAFKKVNFNIPVEILVQGATAKISDGEDFLRLTEKYSDLQNVKFLHKNLIGKDWQEAILESDVILMPYAADRYRYHWSAMLFTAIGFFKPVLQSPEINPEVLEKFLIGEAVRLDSDDVFAQQVESFVNTFHSNSQQYREELIKANEVFSPKRFVNNIFEKCINKNYR